jgi:uncharacterized protein DUF3106
MRVAAMQRERASRSRTLFLRAARRAALLVACAMALAGGGLAVAQGPHPAAAAPVSTPREEGVRWQALTSAQREALAPLERDWPGIEAQRKQKWIALAARFKRISLEERARITQRMVEWAKLTPAERGQARLRFEEVRQLPGRDRQERWKAYQALSPEQRQQLAAGAAAAAASAPREAGSHPGRPARDAKEAKANLVPNPALGQAPRPVTPTIVQAAPGATTTAITRRPTPPAHQQIGMPKIAATPEFVNRTTLLPRRGPQAAVVTSGSPPRPPPAAPAPSPASSAAVR